MAERTKKTIVVNKIGFKKHAYPTEGVAKRMRELGHKVIEYKGGLEEDFFLRNRHFQVYEGYLNFCEKVNADIAFIDTIVCPEHLIADLEVKKNFKPKISFFSTFREPARSLSRANTYKRLIENKHIKKALMISILGNKIDPPSYWKELNIDPSKYSFVGEPLITEIYEEEDMPLEEDIDLPEDKKIGLFFGRDDPSKGLQTLCEAMDLVDESAHIFIVTNGTGYSEERAFELEKENTSVVYRRIKDSEIKSIYEKCDFVVLPYKKSYEYGGSGVLKIAVDFNKPVIVPDLYPFNKIIELFKIGITFDTENSRSLAEAIEHISMHLNKIKKVADFRGYESILSTYDKLADLILED